MSNIYALSDIHGKMTSLLKTLENIDLENPENSIIFLGDYINGGPDSAQVLSFIFELTKKYPNQVIALMGNHEEDFLEFIFGEDDLMWLSQDKDLNTVRSFMKEEQLQAITIQVKNAVSKNEDFYESMSGLIISIIKENYKELLSWVQKLPRYYETNKQIYVHAGILEEAEDLWKYGTPEEYFTTKYPATIGYFYKDIISGHIASAEVAQDTNFFGKVYWDEESHFYIDGTTTESGIVPLLKYDTNTGVYSSFEKLEEGQWNEYVITSKEK